MANKHIGSSFDDFLAEEGRLEEATATAMKRLIAWQIEQEMKAQKLSKTAMAARMHTSRA
ncbi:Fis family transcriptional regulator, partial [Burkholderia multivorans]